MSLPSPTSLYPFSLCSKIFKKKKIIEIQINQKKEQKTRKKTAFFLLPLSISPLSLFSLSPFISLEKTRKNSPSFLSPSVYFPYSLFFLFLLFLLSFLSVFFFSFAFLIFFCITKKEGERGQREKVREEGNKEIKKRKAYRVVEEKRRR